MNPENPAVLSDEDAYAAMIAETRAQATPEATPAAAEAPQAPQDERPRDEHGRFAPRQEGAQEAAPAEKEPFDGFSALPPAVQEQFRGMLKSQEQLRRERDSFRGRFTHAHNNFLALQRQAASAGSGRQSQPANSGQSPAAVGSGHQAQPGIAQARADVATMAPGQQRDNANRQLDAWEKHAQQYPDDAAAIQQYANALREDILAGIAPQLQELGQLREQVNGLRSVAEQFQHQQHETQRRENVAVLDEIAPGWDVLSGWKDEQGNPVAEWKGFHPAMEAWLDGHDPEEKAELLKQMSHSSPRVAAMPYRAFLTDWEAVNGSSGQQTTAPNPVAQRRADAIRDVAPTGAGGSPTPAWRQGLSEEDQHVETMKWMRANAGR